jgi:hypothetical protein
MRFSKLTVAALASTTLCACVSRAGDGLDQRMFGKHARMREVSGEVVSIGANGWGSRYIVVKDVGTALRVYVQSDAAGCVPGKAFKARGHLSRAAEKDYDATFHLHLTDPDNTCG